MKVMVTGATGFLGRHLVRRLMREPGITTIVRVSRRHADAHPLLSGVHLTELPTIEDANCDLASEMEALHLLARYQPDVIFHLAGNPLIKEGSPDITRVNTLSTHNLLAHCKEGCRFVLASSAAIYGNNAGHWASEEEPLTPNSVYGASKAAAELLTQAYDSKVSSVSLRLVANVGKWATHGLVRDLIRKLLSPTAELELLGDSPGSRKPYVHASDTAEAFVRFGLKMSVQGAINVTSVDTLSVREVAEVVMDALDIHKPVHWLGEKANWAGDNRVVKVSSGRAAGFGWVRQYDFSSAAVFRGVEDMVSDLKKEAI